MDCFERTNEVVLYEKCKRLWGLPFQHTQLAEEGAELAVAALHMNRTSKASLMELAGEIADVEFMIREMKHYYPQLVSMIEEQRIFKTKRLEERVAEGEKKCGGKTNN